MSHRRDSTLRNQAPTSMPRPAPLRLDLWTRRLVLWCLLLALPFEGLSVSRAQMLGADHFHREIAIEVAPMEGWRDFRRSAHLGDSSHRAASHAGVQRHHHGYDDASVVSADSTGAGSPADMSSSTVSAIWLVFSPAGELHVACAAPTRSTWPRPAVDAIQSGVAKRLDRPPQA